MGDGCEILLPNYIKIIGETCYQSYVRTRSVDHVAHIRKARELEQVLFDVYGTGVAFELV